MKCLDTNLLVAILRGDVNVETVGMELDRDVRSSTTVINAFEIFYGANRSQQRAKNLEKARTLIQRLDVLPLELRAAERAGELLVNLASQGIPIEYRDAMIAGIVLESDTTLVTRNIKHLTRIPKMKLEKW